MKKSTNKLLLILMVALVVWVSTATDILAQDPMDMPTLDPNTIPKFVNQLDKPDEYAPTVITDKCGNIIRHEYTVNVDVMQAQVLPPGFPKTKVIAYGGLVKVPGSKKTVFKRTYPGSTFEMIRDIPAIVHWRNNLKVPHFLPVDPTLEWANPNNFPPPVPPFIPFPPGYPQAQFPIPHTTHVHGIEVRAGFDGQPETWFTFNGIVGPDFVGKDYFYPNSNEPATFWYHDHVFGITRLNVYAGLTGFFLLRDPKNPLEFPKGKCPQILPKGKYEVPLVIQDRSFNADGSFFYPRVGDVPDLHPYWNLMFNGQVNVVNGKVWPNLNVERRQYRFRLLNAANQRFYNFRFSNGMTFTQIGTDGGFKEKPAELNEIFMGVTERADILVDFSKFAPGTKIVLQNTAQLTPPIGPAPNPNTDGVVMQFTVVDSPEITPPSLPATLNTIAELKPDSPPRILIQNADTNEAGQIITAMLDGQQFHSPVSELPQVGSTEDWQFTNLTPIDHTKHVHLIQFQVLNRQAFDAERYLADWLA
ncbi:MAG TPA: multicopper oxidase domain-containing protein, partial [Bacillota bacterium]|nr:multicopper oxidase domain-containing protein [Bacillota bacterium]